LNLGIHAIANSTYSLDQALLTVYVNLDSQRANEDLERIGSDVRVIAPNTIKESFTREHVASASHEIFKQCELPTGKRHGHPSTADLAGLGIENEVADLKAHAFYGWSLACYCAKPRQKLGHSEWLGKVVVDTQVKCGHDISHGVTGGQREHGEHMATAAQAPYHFEAVDARQHDIEDRNIEEIRFGVRQTLFPIERKNDRMAFLFEAGLQHAGQTTLILHDQDMHGIAPPFCIIS
jgi:hypothetical protein